MAYFTYPPPPAQLYLADKNHYTPGRVIPPQLICLHTTEGYNAREILSRTPNSKRSAHRYITRTGQNWILVNREDTAWTNGPSKWFTAPGSQSNQLSAYLTIEMEHLHTADPNYPIEQIRAVAYTCVYWWSIYGPLPIVYHYQVQGNKIDPPAFPRKVFDNIMLAELWKALHN